MIVIEKYADLLNGELFHPANVCLDEDVFRLVSRRRLQDALIKTNIFVLAIRLQDVLQKRLQDVFRTSYRHLQYVLQRCLQDISKTYHQVKLPISNCLPRSSICLGHTSEKFMVSKVS